jgi:DNA-directed RNA polymerase subunit M/transcription elongation factor TFIIS
MHRDGDERRLLGCGAGEVGEMTEVREPVFMQCKVCKHEWIGMYLPMHITRAAAILQGLRCPNCGNDSASIFIKAKEDADG